MYLLATVPPEVSSKLDEIVNKNIQSKPIMI